MAKDARAGQRASIARTSRVRQERADKAEQQRAAAARPTAQWKEQERKVEERKAADRAAAEEKEAAKKAEAERKREDAAKAALKRAEDLKKKTAQRRERQLQEDAKREFNRKAEGSKIAAAKAEQAKAAIQVKRAEAMVAAQEKTQLADLLAAQRRDTSQIRQQHRAEIESHRHNISGGHVHHAVKIGAIDAAERRDLQALDQQRNSIAGRITAVARPGHFDRQEKAIAQRHEADRMTKHRDQEALQERQFTAMQAARLRQAHERKAGMETHRFETLALRHAQQTNRPHEVEQHKAAIQRVEARQVKEQDHKQERTNGHDRSDGLQRSHAPA